jgi:transcriptional regulator with XRE-family HTH domain
MEPLPNKTLGQRLRELRQNADLSLRDLGDKLKDPTTNTPVSAAFLSDIENGRRFPSDDMIEKLAEILGADAHELRRCDPRGPAKEMQELATMNPKYAFAFRRAVDFVHDQNMPPQEFIRRVENSKAAELIQKIETHLARPLSPVEIDRLWAAAKKLFPSPPSTTSNDPET